MSDFLIYAARMQDAGVCSLWISLGIDAEHTRLMHVSPDASVPRELAAKYPTRTFDLDGDDRVLQQVKDEISYSDSGVTPEKVQAAIAAHPMLRDDLTEWFADCLLMEMPTQEDVEAEPVDEGAVERTLQYTKGLMRGIDILQARKARKASEPTP